jgi:hypothetical protein
LLEHFDIPQNEIAAIRVNNEIRPLNDSLVINATVEPVVAFIMETLALRIGKVKKGSV